MARVTPIKNIKMGRGETFRYRFTRKINGSLFPFSGYTARMKARKNGYNGDVVIDIDTSDGGITLGNGTVDIVISATDTANLPAENLVYDIEIVAPGGDVTRLVQGTIIVTNESTR